MSYTTRVYWKMNEGEAIYDNSMPKYDISVIADWIHNIELIRVLIKGSNRKKNICLKIGKFSL